MLLLEPTPVPALAAVIFDMGGVIVDRQTVANRALVEAAKGHGVRLNVSYRYAAPSVGYEALLAVDDLGFVIDYPGLWQAAQDPNPDS